MASNDQHAAMFLQLVFTFQSAAWQHMGKIKNPITDKVEKDLMQAHFSIDMLEMIRAKTEGNLTDEEKRLIDGTLSQLQLNYVDEFNKQQAEDQGEAKEEEKVEEGKEEEKSEVESKAEVQSTVQEDKDVKKVKDIKETGGEKKKAASAGRTKKASKKKPTAGKSAKK